jgi:tRNA1(Val) A37 N6-methylase TrmN6
VGRRGIKMGENKKFKFDVIIGNPPYQEETSQRCLYLIQSNDSRAFEHPRVHRQVHSFPYKSAPSWYTGTKGIYNKELISWA